MKSFILFIALAIAIAAVLPACQTQGAQNSETSQAILFWTGEVAADGCGFEIVIAGRKYIPENEAAIDESFKKSDSTLVQLEYIRLPEPIDRRCGMLPQPRIMDAIQVLSVKRL